MLYAPSIRLDDYTYTLPDDRIADRPLAERDASRLLFSAADGGIADRTFRELPMLLPQGSALVVNRTRVIHARLRLRKPTGGLVEVFVTRPVAPTSDPAVALASTDGGVWECLLGGRNISVGMDLVHDATGLSARIVDRTGTEAHVQLSWTRPITLAQILVEAGDVPLPPYIKRATDEDDRDRYQTVFAQAEGSVAAPTASLHFTPSVLAALEQRRVQRIDVTLHVGLGTFKPVDVADVRDHLMHVERYGITRNAAAALAAHARSTEPWCTVVGTTAMRTMESLFCVGARVARNGVEHVASLDVGQWEAFDRSLDGISRAEALDALVAWMDAKGLDEAWGDTAILLAPGCRIAMVDALITNFHQPGNTLLLLVAAFIGERWRNVYAHALRSGYRFLSYGDASLLVRSV